MKNFRSFITGQLTLILAALVAVISILSLYSKLVIDYNLIRNASLTIVATIISILYSALLFWAVSRRIEQRKSKVFISFNVDDEKLAKQVELELLDYGVKPIIPQDHIKIGDDINRAIDNLIKDADYFVFFDHPNNMRELKIAKNYNIKILPVKGVKEFPKGLTLTDVMYADLATDTELGIEALKKSIKVSAYSSFFNALVGDIRSSISKLVG